MSTSTPLDGLPDFAQQTIETMQSKIAEYEQEILKKKKGINAILDSFDKQPIYSDLESSAAADAGPIHPGQFYGQPLATNVRAILTRRRLANKNAGPATITEIFDALSTGGYEFETSEADNAKRGLRNSIGKNPIFHKLPTGHYGLTEWFPNIKPGKSKAADDKSESPSSSPAAEPDKSQSSTEPPTENGQTDQPSKARKAKAEKASPVQNDDDEFAFEEKEAELTGAKK